MRNLYKAKEQIIDESERSPTQHERAEGAPIGSENRLISVMKTIVDSDYDSMEELVARSDSYSIGEIHALFR